MTCEILLNVRMLNTKEMADVPEGSDEKPVVCPVPGCTKRYKNINGMKYHSKNSHQNEVG